MKKIFTLSISLVFLSACSHYRRPESFQEKMARFESKNLSANVVPNYQAIAYKNAKANTPSSRAPASSVDALEGERFQNYSGKGLYFLSLYWQFEELKNFSTQDFKSIKSCPHFHTAILNNQIHLPHNKKIAKALSLEQSSQWSERPEFSLPLKAYQKKPTVLEASTQNPAQTKFFIQEAINLHAQKTLSELNELCEFGSSDNYYAFENLMTYAKDNTHLAPTQTHIQAMLKTTILSNYALIHSLNGKEITRAPSSYQQSEQKNILNKILKNLKAPWFSEYLEEYR